MHGKNAKNVTSKHGRFLEYFNSDEKQRGKYFIFWS